MKRRNLSERSGGKRFGRKSKVRTLSVREDQDRLLKIIGIILVSTMILSVFCSIWFGWKIRTGLTALDYEKVVSRNLEEKALVLETRRAELMARDVIEKKASVLGLRKPGPNQIIRP